MDCIEPDAWERKGLDALAESGDHPSIYVGESARSICERSSEHWRDALAGKDESHMVEHRALANCGQASSTSGSKLLERSSHLWTDRLRRPSGSRGEGPFSIEKESLIDVGSQG